MNQFLGAAPRAQVVHGELACAISLNDLADRPPRAIGDEVLDLGGKRMRFIPTPHVPHNWESGLWFEETTRTLLAGDLLTSVGNGPAVTSDDVVAVANAAEDLFHQTSMGPDLVPTIHRLADLDPMTLAVMHGSSYAGNGAAQLRSLADSYDERLAVLAA
jgi:flavorubredoxin